MGDLVRTAALNKTFSKGDTTMWSQKLYEISEVVSDTKPSFKADFFPKKSNEVSMEETELPMKENDSVMEQLNLY